MRSKGYLFLPEKIGNRGRVVSQDEDSFITALLFASPSTSRVALWALFPFCVISLFTSVPHSSVERQITVIVCFCKLYYNTEKRKTMVDNGLDKGETKGYVSSFARKHTFVGKKICDWDANWPSAPIRSEANRCKAFCRGFFHMDRWKRYTVCSAPKVYIYIPKLNPALHVPFDGRLYKVTT